MKLIIKLGGICLKCGEQNISKLELDHIRPIKVNGNRCNQWKDVNNLQVLCSTCNKSKGDNFIDYRVSAGEQ